MKKSGVRSPESGIRTKKSPKSETSKIENRNAKLSGSSAELRISNFEPRSPSPTARPRTSNSGPRTLVIGYGNPLRSDDGFGWHASHLLAEALADRDVEVITCHQLTPELAERLSNCAVAVFIDADCRGAPGEIHSQELLAEAAPSSTFTHTCTPSGLLVSAERLYGHRPQAVILTVSAQSFEYGESLSPVVSAALPKVAEQVCRYLRLP